MDTGKLGVWYFFDGMSSADAAAAAKRIESLGYGTLWIPETVGKNPTVLASWLLANTETLNLATGVIRKVFSPFYQDAGLRPKGWVLRRDSASWRRPRAESLSRLGASYWAWVYLTNRWLKVYAVWNMAHQ